MVAYAVARRTASLATAGTSWTAFASDGSFDVTVDAAAGDVVEVSVNTVWNTAGQYRWLDVATMVAGSPVTWISTGTASHGNGPLAWFSPTVSDYFSVANKVFYTVQAGDVVAGQVTFRLYGKSSAGGVGLLVTTALPAYFSAANVSGDLATAGSFSGSLTTTASFISGTAVLPASVGDVLRIYPNIVTNNAPASSYTATYDVGVVDATSSGSLIRYVTTGTTAFGGIPGWGSDLADYQAARGSFLYVVQSGDLVSGQVCLRVAGKVATATRSVDTTSLVWVRKAA